MPNLNRNRHFRWGLLSILLLALTAGCLTQGQIGDLVWLDLNVNGIQDEGEPGVAGVQVTIYAVGADGSRSEVATTLTNDEGEFFFDNLEEGQDYQLEFVPPEVEDLGFTSMDVGEDDAIDSDANPFTGETEPFTFDGEANLDLDAGLRDMSEVGAPDIFGIAWRDENFDGIQDPGEPPVEDMEIILSLVVTDPATGVQALIEVHSVRTDGNGRYVFNTPPPGDYVLSANNTTGDPYDITIPDVGDDDLDNDFSPLSLQTEVFPVAFGPATVHAIYDLGVAPLHTIADWVWLDGTFYGIQDDGEEGVENVEVILYGFDENGDQEELDRTVTDEDGFYEFVDLYPGFYFLEFVLPGPEYFFTILDQGNDDAVDSDADRIFGTTDVFLLTGDDETWDAGLVRVSFGDGDIPDEPVITTYQTPDAILPGDEVGFGPFNCSTGELLSTLGVEFTGFRVQQTAGFVYVTFFFRGPLGDLFSFAIVPEFYSEADFSSPMSSFLFEYHDGMTNTAMFDNGSGQIPADQVDGLEIGADLEAGIVAFLIDKGLLPPVFDFFSPTLIAMATADAVRACLFFSLHDLTQAPPTSTNGDGDHDDESTSTTTTDFDGTVDEFTFAGGFHQEDGELVVRYRVEDADGNPVDGIGRATIAVGSPGGDRAEHGDAEFNEEGFVEIRLPLDKFEEGEEVDVWIFFDGLSAAIPLGSFTVGQ